MTWQPLRVKLDAHGRRTLVLQALHRTVRGPCGRDEIPPQPVRPLVMSAVYSGRGAEQLLQQACLSGADGVEYVLRTLVQGRALRPQI